MTSYIQIITTTSQRKNANEIADRLVKKKLAACVQIVGPIRSTFVWKGKIEKVTEWMCFIKTKQSIYKKAEVEIKSVHKYKVPEILAFPITKGNERYLDWLQESLE